MLCFYEPTFNLPPCCQRHRTHFPPPDVPLPAFHTPEESFASFDLSPVLLCSRLIVLPKSSMFSHFSSCSSYFGAALLLVAYLDLHLYLEGPDESLAHCSISCWGSSRLPDILAKSSISSCLTLTFSCIYNMRRKY